MVRGNTICCVKRLLLIVLFSLSGVLYQVVGCGGQTRRDALPVVLEAIEASTDISGFSVVLSQVVDNRGRLIPARLAGVHDRLVAQLKRMAAYGPTATPEMYPDENSRLAYWYNARTAWSIRLAEMSLHGNELLGREQFTRSFPLDGRIMSLNKIDSILLSLARGSGDFRIAACVPGVRAGYAPLPQKPFSRDGFQERLCEQLNRLVLDENRFVIDIEHKRVLVPPMLWACRDMVISKYQQRFGRCRVNLLTAMGVYLNPRARFRLRNALGYRIVPRQGAGRAVIQPRKLYYPGKVGKIEL